jgi:hypothetical protein
MNPMNRVSEGALHRLARRNIVPSDLMIVSPSQEGIAGQLGAVVAHDRLGLATLAEEPIELAGHPDARDAGSGIAIDCETS